MAYYGHAGHLLSLVLQSETIGSIHIILIRECKLGTLGEPQAPKPVLFRFRRSSATKVLPGPKKHVHRTGFRVYALEFRDPKPRNGVGFSDLFDVTDWQTTVFMKQQS